MLGLQRCKPLRALALAGSLAAALPACSYVQAVSETNIPISRGKPVEARTKRFIFLGFVFDNDEILQLTPQLQAKCPGGAITGVLTKDIHTLYFLQIFWAREVVATGYCQKSGLVDAGDGSDPLALRAGREPQDLNALPAELRL